jgi:glucose/arabinose dehydrogenase
VTPLRLVIAVLGVSCLLLAAACGSAGNPDARGRATAAAPQTSRSVQTRLVRVAAGFDEPVHVASPRSGNRLYIVEQPGRIIVLDGGRRRVFLDIRQLVESGGEQGLLSVAFSPNYRKNHRFYVDYTDVNGDTRVVEYRSNGNRGLPGTARQLLFVRQPYSNHNGGQLAFGPDGRLYVGMGDGGSGGDPQNRAQNLNSRLGKLLRINVNTRPARVEIAAYGLRNPWRFSFDRANGDLWIGDVGQGAFEEIDYTPARSPGLENYGWDVYEGRSTFENKPPNPAGTLEMPFLVYGRGSGCTVIGGFVYRGQRVRAARGRYFYGDYCSGNIWSVRQQNGRPVQQRREPFRVEALVSFGESARGELYLVSHEGVIYRLAA